MPLLRLSSDTSRVPPPISYTITVCTCVRVRVRVRGLESLVSGLPTFCAHHSLCRPGQGGVFEVIAAAVGSWIVRSTLKRVDRRLLGRVDLLIADRTASIASRPFGRRTLSRLLQLVHDECADVLRCEPQPLAGRVDAGAAPAATGCG